jgi:para-aminobenzoate synthetase component I
MTLPWFWRSLPLDKGTGSEIFASLFLDKNNSGIATLLESPYPIPDENPQLARYSICAGEPRMINGDRYFWTPELGEVLPFLEKLIKKEEYTNKSQTQFQTQSVSTTTPPDHLPFTGGWLGWLGYDVAWEIEKLPYLKTDTLPFPIAFWYEPESFAVLDHWQQILWLAASSVEQLDKLEKSLEKPISKPSSTSLSNYPSPPLNFQTSQDDYERAVEMAKKHIQCGDIFQSNLTLRFESQTTLSGWDIYNQLQKINPSPFASYWRSPWGEVVSCSPERLVKLENGIAETRPIAGTRPRGKTMEEDKYLAQELLNNTKERAEHIMLVDLERNDLGRVSTWGTVEVDELLTIERYSHVMHLVSNVRGTLQSGKNPIDLIKAMFPGGTITGCPKVRCMEIIEELEPLRRSLFYGSCGYIDIRGNLDLNILIRTLLMSKLPLPTHQYHPIPSQVWGQVGAGIVADSIALREWHESLHKAEAQIAALQNRH